MLRGKTNHSGSPFQCLRTMSAADGPARERRRPAPRKFPARLFCRVGDVEPEERILDRRVRFADALPHPLDDFGMSGGDVVLLAAVGGDVEQLHPRIAVGDVAHEPFPLPDPHRKPPALLAEGRELPVKVGVFGLRAARERRHQRDAVGGGRFDSGDLAQRGHHIGKIADVVADGGSQLIAPRRDEGHADAAFVQRAFRPSAVAAEGVGAVEPQRVGVGVVGRAVVAREEDDRVVVDAEPFELLDQLADLMIEIGDHRGVGGARIAAGEIAFARVDRLFVAELLDVMIDVGVGCGQCAVRNGSRPHQEKFVVAVLAHERNDVVVECVGAVNVAFEVGVTLPLVGVGALRKPVAQFHRGVVEAFAAAVAVEEARVVVLRRALAEVAVEEVEAHRVRRARGVGPSEAPFSDHCGFVTRLLHDGGEGRRAGAHRRLSFERGILFHRAEFPYVAAGGLLVVGSDLRMSRVQSREQAAA